ncbi:MAG: hypothetical protein ACRDRS_06370 [Pseudonocardiaceae bacterium]
MGNRLGQPCGGAEVIADRRGSRVYRLRFPTGDVALKLASHNTEEQGVRDAEHLARREAAVLAHLNGFIPGYLIDSGDLDSGGSWLALRWLEGCTPHRLIAAARRGDDSPARRDSILHAAIVIIDRLAALPLWAGGTPTSNPHILLGHTYALAAVLHLAWTGLPPLPIPTTKHPGETSSKT